MANDRLEVPAKIDSRHPSAKKTDPGLTPWSVKGELILNCNCTIFCPCVVSLGKHAPTALALSVCHVVPTALHAEASPPGHELASTLFQLEPPKYIQTTASAETKKLKIPIK